MKLVDKARAAKASITEKKPDAKAPPWTGKFAVRDCRFHYIAR
jgi:hypothetical protein